MKFFAVFCIFVVIAAAHAHPLEDEESVPQPDAPRDARQFPGNGQFNAFAFGGTAQQNNQGFGNTQGNQFQFGGSAQQNNQAGGNSQYNNFDQGGSAIQNNGK